jgi:CRISPR-associated protein Csx17
VDLLRDVDDWLTKLSNTALSDKCPASVASRVVTLERQIADLTVAQQQETPARLIAVLAALGATERALARSFKWTKEAYLRPLHGLRPDWLAQADDGSVEFRLASALAATRAWLSNETLWFREHLEPLSMGSTKERSWASWADQPTNDVAWHDGDLTDALNAILSRRLVRVEKSGARGWPDWSPRAALLADITAFIERRTNDTLLADLIWGLSLVDWAHVPEERITESAEEAIPSSFYALLRLCFRRAGKDEDAIPLVPAILHRAINGQGKESSVLAARRLRASGQAPLVDELPVAGDIARRTAAAILFPISPRDFRLLEHTTLKQPTP